MVSHVASRKRKTGKTKKNNKKKDTETHILLLQMKNYNSGDKRMSQFPSKTATLSFTFVAVKYVRRHKGFMSGHWIW